MICINSKRNQKLLQTFNKDVYSDISITTEKTTINLVLSYLSIDSQYFDNIDKDTKQINLEHLHGSSLIKVLRSLYGQQLCAYSILQLKQLYKIIEFLQINEYKANIERFILKNPQLLDNFELIQFCFNKQILVKQIKQRHFQNKLAIFVTTKNYLQLNKISQPTINTFLLEYYSIKGAEADDIINSVIENYIGRNNLRPNHYFLQPGLEPLLNIWQKFHHSISYLINAQQKTRQSQIGSVHQQTKKSSISAMNSQNSPFGFQIPTLATNPSIGMSSSLGQGFFDRKVSSSSFSSEIQQKQQKIQELEQKIAMNKEIISTMQKQIGYLKTQNNKQKFGRVIQSDQEQENYVNYKNREKQFTQVLNLQHKNSHGQKGTKIQKAGGQKQKKVEINTGKSEIKNPDIYDVSLIEPPLNQERRIFTKQGKQVHTMQKLNSRKKIFYP